MSLTVYFTQPLFIYSIIVKDDMHSYRVLNPLQNIRIFKCKFFAFHYSFKAEPKTANSFSYTKAFHYDGGSSWYLIVYQRFNYKK